MGVHMVNVDDLEQLECHPAAASDEGVSRAESRRTHREIRGR